MKHKKNIIKQLQKKLIGGEVGALSGLTFEFFVYFSTLGFNKKCFVVNRETIEKLSIIFQDEIGLSVGCLLAIDKEDVLVSNFYNNISSISQQALSTNKNLSLCFVEDSLFKTPLLSNKKTKGFVVDKNTGFDLLISWFELCGFFSGLNGQLSMGEYFVNGGVVDVRLFDNNRLYRVSFLDDTCSLFLVNLKTNLIIKPISSFIIYPQITKGAVSPKDFFGSSFFIGFLNNGVLSQKKGGKKKQKLSILPVDYHGFKGVGCGVFYYKVPFELERGFCFKNTYFVPLWFIKNNGNFTEKTKPHVLDGKSFLNIGSLYVHDDFGVCRFLGLDVYNNKERICLEFLDGVVRVGVQYISKLSFYSENQGASLHYLNKPGKWKRQKKQAQDEAKKYINHIIKTYSYREGVLSFPWKTNNSMLVDFIGAFEHKDTPDQARCWGEIKQDLSSKKPMNRLVCGDVGFGKTEIAIRAAFVAVLNNQQVVVLAPTTILANQLYQSFFKRLCDFGVRVNFLSSLSENKHVVVNNYIEKQIDVLIGTSSLLFQKPLLKQCGLFIVDEEHKFGVKDKELVLSVNPSVNFLSLSATPIPRSLQFSLNNIRSLSLIQTPPIERRPVLCFSSSFNIRVVVGAILKEINRGGLVFFVDNSVDNLKKTLLTLRAKLPYVSFGLIYSRLHKQTLTKTMNSFINGKTQVLLSTTIIESGIDIGLANTIIINNAHLFGLSQLYQLRGRVGRSYAQAFAWFLSPYKRHTPEGTKRLKTIIRHTALGSGYQIAVSDLNIRGGGALFGYKQSGEGGVGFEFYTKLIELAINKKRVVDCVVDIYNFSLSSVLSDQAQCSYFYNCVFSVKSIKELKQLKKDFISLFGSLFRDFDLLIKTKEVGLLAGKKNIIKITKKQGVVFVVFDETLSHGLTQKLFIKIESFFNELGVVYKFIKSQTNFTFQYQSVNENDYILLLDFINKLPN